jgi:plasmid stabilization system protein ParE
MATLTTLFKIGADISDLQAGMTKAVASIDAMEKNTSKVTNTLGAMGKALAGAISVAAISNAVRSFTELTGRLTDLSIKTGISTTELQKLKFAAEQSGSTLEGVTKGIGFMARALVEGDSGAANAMKRLGLSIMEVRQMQPGQAFATIVDAVAKLPNVMEQSAVMTKLFGRAGADLLPMVKTNLQETMEAAQRLGLVLDEQTVRAGDDLGDSLTVLTTVGSALIAKVLQPLLPALITVAQWLGSAANGLETLQGWFQQGMTWGLKFFKTILDGAIAVQEMAGKMPLLGRAIGAADGEVIKAGKSMSQWLDDTIKGMQVEIPKAVPPVHNLRAAIGQTEPQMRSASKAMKEASDAAEKFGQSVRTQATAALREQWASGVLQNINAMLRQKREELMLLLPIEYDWARANQQTTQTLHDMVAAGMRLPAVTDEQIKKFLTVTEKTVTWRDELTNLAQAMTDLAQTANNKFVSAMASMVNGINVGIGAVKSLKGGFDTMTSGGGLTSILKGFTGIVSGIGGIVSAAQAAISIGKALFGIFDRDKGRDLVEKFAAEFGGFDAIQAMMAQLGDEGHRLWVALTQGKDVHSNPDAARRIIEEVRAAIERLQATARSGVSVTYHSEGDLGGGIEGFATGTGGIRDFGAGTLAMLHGREGVYTEAQVAKMGGGEIVIHNVTYLDGEVVARNTERRLNNRWRGRQLVGAV